MGSQKPGFLPRRRVTARRTAQKPGFLGFRAVKNRVFCEATSLQPAESAKEPGFWGFDA